jgi:hypothetical protein
MNPSDMHDATTHRAGCGSEQTKSYTGDRFARCNFSSVQRSGGRWRNRTWTTAGKSRRNPAASYVLTIDWGRE